MPRKRNGNKNQKKSSPTETSAYSTSWTEISSTEENSAESSQTKNSAERSLAQTNSETSSLKQENLSSSSQTPNGSQASSRRQKKWNRKSKSVQLRSSPRIYKFSIIIASSVAVAVFAVILFQHRSVLFEYLETLNEPTANKQEISNKSTSNDSNTFQSKNANKPESSKKSSSNGFQSKNVIVSGWRPVDNETLRLYDDGICNIERRWAHELTVEEFERDYREKKIVIIKFKNGASDWTDPNRWTVAGLKKKFGHWNVVSGNSLEIVRKAGNAYIDSTLSRYVDKIINEEDTHSEPPYVFDRDFFPKTKLVSTLKVPSYIVLDDPRDGSFFFIGASGTGVVFHKHAQTFNAVVYGRKRWFLYPVEKTPPGGIVPGFTQLEWYHNVYPNLTKTEKPIECIQEEGEILYLPENIYHATINLGDTVGFAIQGKEARSHIGGLFERVMEIPELVGESKGKEKEALVKEGRKKIDELIRLCPGNSEVNVYAGNLYDTLGDFFRSRGYYQRAVELDRYYTAAMLLLGESEMELGSLAEAEKWYKKALELNLKFWDSYLYYGDFLVDSGRAKEALKLLKKGQSLLPSPNAGRADNFRESIKRAKSLLRS